MARYVLLQIDDTVQAEALVGSLQGQEDATANLFFYNYLEGNEGEYAVGQIKVQVVGLFGKPTNTCDCKLVGEVVKGAKFGWFICTTCKRARPGWQYPRNLVELPPPGPTVWERLHNHMFTLGAIEGLDHNPASDWRPPAGRGSAHRGKRS